MANKQALQVEEQFEVVKALYEEAKLTLPAEERAQFIEIEAKRAITISDDTSAEISNESNGGQPVIIRSRKPRAPANAEPIFTRISDLYEEANAVKILAEETAHITNDDMQETLSEDQAEDETTSLAPPHSQSAIDDDFAIPAEFGASAPESDEYESDEDESGEDEDLGEIKSDQPLSEEELALLSQNIQADEGLAERDVTISDDIEPAVALDDVLDGLLPPDVQDETTTKEAPSTTSAEAQALSELDANRPEADDALKEQLADVKQAVEQAATGGDAVQADISDEASEEKSAHQQDDMASLTPSPALAQFIGETVRDVLDEELPQLVRGLVDETLGERQGRYGRTDTPHIGLRTKPSRH